MKRVSAIVIYEAYVPEDMDLNQVREAFERQVEGSDDIRINVHEYHDEAEAEPLFEYRSFEVATSFTLATSL